jgi:hypothetical protein
VFVCFFGSLGLSPALSLSIGARSSDKHKQLQPDSVSNSRKFLSGSRRWGRLKNE